MQQLYSHSITYRIAIGPHQGRKVFTLQTLPPVEEPKKGMSRIANVAGFSLHAGVMADGIIGTTMLLWAIVQLALPDGPKNPYSGKICGLVP